MDRYFRFVAVSLIVLAGGCAVHQPHPADTSLSAPKKQETAEAAAIASALQQAQTPESDYKIGSEDQIEVSVYQQPDLDRRLRISQNGTISLPLIGTIKIGGLSISEAEALIVDRLKEFVITPQVTLFIKEYNAKKVFILGEVIRPGSYDLPPESPLTVVEAISLAGGTTAIAAPDRTKIIRTVEGKNQVFLVEVSAITKRGEKDKDLPLRPRDVVYVPQSFF